MTTNNNGNTQMPLSGKIIIAAIILFSLLVIFSCNWAKVQGPDDAVPVGAVLPIRNNAAETNPGFITIMTNGGTLVERLRFGQVATIDLSGVPVVQGSIYFTAGGYRELPNGTLEYVGCDSYMLDVWSALNYRDIRPWAVSRLSLYNSDC